MFKSIKISTHDSNTESPTEFADRLGVEYSKRVKSNHKKDLGQFFTPREIARFMAQICVVSKTNIRILDPGFGVGILSAALVESIALQKPKTKSIELVAFETDVEILPLAESSMNYLRNWLKKKKIDFKFFLCKNDFVLHNSLILSNKVNVQEKYDVVISNPPYFKLSKNDERAIAAKSVIYGQTNIYSIFLIIAAKLLSIEGQLVFITPRSFCSGSYFRLFREIFFSIIDLNLIHLFNSRKESFKRDEVLQENIIISAINKRKLENDKAITSVNIKKNHILISTSEGIRDLEERKIKKFYFNDLVNLESFQKILHLPVTDADEKIINIFKTWTGSLNSYGLEISTGPVVDFRNAKQICSRKLKSTVPLIWLHNILPMEFKWPKNTGYKGKPKGQYFLNSNESSVLIDNKNYVFLRRFSSKDDKRRLIAAPYFKNKLPAFSKLGIENHLNYIYGLNSELTADETNGIAAILNSRLFDLYFRTFNGNINVSATELRDFPLPSFDLIRKVGKRIVKGQGITSSLEIDYLIEEIFNLPIDLNEIYG